MHSINTREIYRHTADRSGARSPYFSEIMIEIVRVDTKVHSVAEPFYIQFLTKLYEL